MGYAKTQGSNFIVLNSLISTPILITTVPANFTLGSIVIPAYDGSVFLAYGDIEFTQVVNQFAGTNYIAGDVKFQVSPDNSHWYDAGTLKDSTCYLYNGQISSTLTFHGDVDIKGYFSPGSTLYFRINNGVSQGDSLFITSCYSVLKVYFL